jgi:DNA-binding transcriptional ArsR family regulator
MAAMADSLRSKLLIAIGDGAGVSVRQIAELVGEPQRKVRYHLDALMEQGLITVAAKRRRRGVVERYYRLDVPPVLTTEHLESVEREQAQKISLNILRAILADAGAAAKAGLFAARPGHATIRIRGDVDTQGWEELSSLQERTMDRAQAILSQAGERLGASGERPVSLVVALLLFEASSRPN